MSNKRFLIAANWKMNPIPTRALAADSPYRTRSSTDVIVFPTFLDIAACIAAGLITGGQYGHPQSAGAFTGDVSIAMLKAAGCRYVLCGHSERRTTHHETDEIVATQVRAALEAGLHPVVCIGETAAERAHGRQQAILERQLQELPLHSDLTLAYEPVWAIGTGQTATPMEAQAMHAFIRSRLPAERQYSARILYGGSMKPENATELLRQPDIDGGLIGGAALQPTQFAAIVEAADRSWSDTQSTTV